MQQIYQNAVEVVVFIGDGLGHRIQSSNLKRPSSTPAENLFGDKRDNTFMSQFAKYIHSASLKDVASPAKITFSAIGLVLLLSDTNTLNKPWESFTTLMTIDDTLKTRLFEYLRELMVSPWWNRIWVVQEIAVSRAATIHYGTVSVPWTVFTRAAKNLSTNKNMRFLVESENWKVLSLFESQVSNIERTRVKWHTDGGNDLVQLLQEFSNRPGTRYTVCLVLQETDTSFCQTTISIFSKLIETWLWH